LQVEELKNLKQKAEFGKPQKGSGQKHNFFIKSNMRLWIIK
jgi:hypothetical protein